MTTFNIRNANLDKLNSLTKYPSIPTYHILDPKTGKLTEDHLDMSADQLFITEKVDGTNSRIILTPDEEWLIGSREELLYASGDLLANPALSIVEAVKELAPCDIYEDDTVYVAYFETYGGNVTKGSRQYTGGAVIGARLFDVARIEFLDEKLSWHLTAYSGWRERDSERFLSEDKLCEAAEAHGWPMVPRYQTASPIIPDSIANTYDWLRSAMRETGCALDRHAGMRPEGVVVRNADRSKIAKLRFEDYEKALGMRGGGKR